MSCISALDEVIAEFDDPSLPYMYEDEGSSLNPNQMVPSINETEEPQQYFSAENKLVFKNHQQQQQEMQQQFPTTSSVLSKSSPTSHLIQIPVNSPNSPKKSRIETKRKDSPSECTTSMSSKLQGKPSVIPRSTTDTGKASNLGGGTYSKGTNYELVLPRIPSSSSRNHVQQEPIYSSIGKSRPQLSVGMFSSCAEKAGAPQEPEIDYNDDPNVYNANDRGGGKLSKSGKKTEGVSVVGLPQPNQMTKELWNFPSEKNLPRSLRKTRKTCFLEEGEKLELKSESLDFSGADGHSTTSSSISSKHNEEVHPNSNNGKKSKADSRKIYGDNVLVTSSSSSSSANNSNANSQLETRSSQCSSSNSLSFSPAPLPKPRVRQQVPKVEETCHVKYPPGKIPKPNPKPSSGGACALSSHQIEVIRELSPTPYSPIQCEISRNDAEECQQKNMSTDQQTHQKANNNATTSPVSTASSGSNNGHVIRMMMMMKQPSAKNNSTGSASSISRSSSSNSDDRDYYHRKDKDNLSSSSGIVVTTNSSASTTSPTHSVNNNSLNTNNNVTIINTEKAGAGASIIEVKGQIGQRVPGVGHNKSTTCQVQYSAGANNNNINVKPAVAVGGNGVLEVDDGYLSMINRNEAPLLWPEEFIENETFSADELKRLSVHLPEEEENSSDAESSDSCSEGKEIELEIVDYEREPSRRQPHYDRSPTTVAPLNRKKTEQYFSDDSLEGDEMNSRHHKKSNNEGPHQQKAAQQKRNNVAMFISANSSPQQACYRQQISVNTAIVQPTKASRIPKKISSGGSKKKGSQSQPETPKRKPCSFFVSLTDEGSPASSPNVAGNEEVTTVIKSASLPLGSKVGVNPSGNNSPGKVQQTPSLQINSEPSTTIIDEPKPSNLPQLRHTKSINTGGPRSANSSNANKRKSTSDLVVTVVNNPDMTNGDPVVVTSSFNRTSTFLIPSPCSRVEEDEPVVRQKRPRDDDTDEEDDFSEFELMNQPDSLQPLSLTDVHDFVSEIMDTALRQELKRTQMALNNYPMDFDETTTNPSSSPLLIQKEQQQSETSGNVEATGESQKEQEISSESTRKPIPSCDNDERKEEEKVEERSTTVAQQLEAVVSNFLSDNQSFLGDDSEMIMIRNECDAKRNSAIISTEQEVQTEQKCDDGESNEKAEETLDTPTDTSNLEEKEQEEEEGKRNNLLQSFEKEVGNKENECVGSSSVLKDSSLVGEEKILDDDETEEEEPPEFVPTPPPHMTQPPPQIPQILQQSNFHHPENRSRHSGGNMHNPGKAALDLLAERINNSKRFPGADDQIPVSQFIHDKRNIWAMYDRPFDEDLIPVPHPSARGYASRSQENLVDAMTKEKFHKSFSARGQSSTLPLNCRPPTSSQRRSSTFRNMFNKFRKNKPNQAGGMIKELPEYHDEVQSITSRETGPSEQGKKRGFFSRLFRRSRKH